MITVAEIMTRDPLTVQRDTPLREIIRLMKVHHCRQFPVIDGETVIGIVTDRDVRVTLNSPYVLHERQSDNDLLNEVTAELCMTPDPLVTAPDTPIIDAARALHQHKFGALPVLADGRLIGIVTVSDLLRHYIELLASDDSDADEAGDDL